MAQSSFDNIVLYEKNSRPVKVKVSVSEDGFTCMTGAGREVKISNDAVSLVDLFPSGKSFTLRLHVGNSTKRLTGFSRAQVEELDLSLGSLGDKVKKQDVSTRGLSWGEIRTQDNALTFMTLQKENMAIGFDIPYSDISSCNLQGKNMIALEFHQDENVANEEECCTEIRFFAPLLADTRPRDLPITITEEISKRANIQDSSADSLFTFKQVMFIVPRGRMDIEAHPLYLKLHGPSASYNVLYKNIQHFFLLQRPDSHLVFVIQMEPPLRQGQTTYPFLLVQFQNDDASLQLPSEKMAQYGVESNETSAAVVSKAIKMVSGKKLFIPKSFLNVNKSHEIRCSLKNDTGFLYPLEKSFVYIPKPTAYFRHEEISVVRFERLAAKDAKSTFDIVFNFKTRDSMTFSGIRRDEFHTIFEYCKAKALPVENPEQAMKQGSAVADTSARFDVADDTYMNQISATNAMEEDDSEDDSDFDGKASASDSEEYSSRSRESDDASGSDKSGSDSEVEKKKEKKSSKKEKSKSDKHKKEGKKESEPKKAKKVKKSNDRGLSPFTRYSRKMRSKLAEENPEMTVDDMQDLISVKWNAFTQEEKDAMIRNINKNDDKMDESD